MAADASAPDRLRERSIGLPHALFQSITHMAPGAAIAFSILFSVQCAGPALPLSVVLALVACLLVASSIGQMARKVPSAGGLYSYVTHGLGAVPGFFVGLIFLCFQPLVAPLLFLIFAWATTDVMRTNVGWDWTGQWVIWVLFAAAVVFFLTYRDVRLSTRAGIALGIFEVGIFAALAIWMILSNLDDLTLQTFNPSHAEAGTFNGIFKGMVFCILAFIGFESSAPLAEETRDPRRNIPKAVIGACLGVGLFYVLCSYAWVIGTGFPNFTEDTLAQANPCQHLADIYWSTGWVLIFLAIVNSAPATSLAIVVYITVCLATIAYYWRKARPEWNWWLHGIFPALGALAFLPPLYYQYRPLAPEPLRFGNYAAIAAFAIAILVTAYVATRKRGVLDNADRIFVEEEFVGPAGPYDVPPPTAPAEGRAS